MKFIRESVNTDDDYNVFDDIRDLREKLGSALLLDILIEWTSQDTLKELTAYVRRRWAKDLAMYEPPEDDEDDDFDLTDYDDDFYLMDYDDEDDEEYSDDEDDEED